MGLRHGTETWDRDMGQRHGTETWVKEWDRDVGQGHGEKVLSNINILEIK